MPVHELIVNVVKKVSKTMSCNDFKGIAFRPSHHNPRNVLT